MKVVITILPFILMPYLLCSTFNDNFFPGHKESDVIQATILYSNLRNTLENTYKLPNRVINKFEALTYAKSLSFKSFNLDLEFEKNYSCSRRLRKVETVYSNSKEKRQYGRTQLHLDIF